MSARSGSPSQTTALVSPKFVNISTPSGDAECVEALARLPDLYVQAVAGRALRQVSHPGPATLNDLAAALRQPVDPPRAAERLAAAWVTTAQTARCFNGSLWLDSPTPTPPPAVMAEAEAHDAEWRRLHALLAAARWTAEFARGAGIWTDDAWLAAAEEDVIAERAKLVAEAHAPGVERRAAREGRMLTPDEARRKCPKAQRRRIRKRAKAVRQFWSAALQLTGGPAKAGCPRFSDDYSLSRHLERQETARAFGKGHNWRRDDGQTYGAWDIMQASAIANLNRLYVEMRGLEDIATDVGLVAIMLTLTLPPEWHPHPSQGECSCTQEHTPAAADRELQRLWAKFRSRLQRADIPPLGLRVVESHTDGCPHLHALLFVAPESLPEVDDALRAVRPDPWDDLAGDPPEILSDKAAERVRRRRMGLRLRVATNIVQIDRNRARASTYVLKYLLKSLNVAPKDIKTVKKGLTPEAATELQQALHGAAVRATVHNLEPEGEDHITDYDRYRALASERCWHRYSLLGVHGMQKIWQRLYRMDEPGRGASRKVVESWRTLREHPAMYGAWQAMQGKRWADALLALGAVRHPLVCDPDAPRAMLLYQSYTNPYGEPALRPIGLRWSTTSAWAMRLGDWTWTLELTKEANHGGAPTVANPLISRARTVGDSVPRPGADRDSEGRQIDPRKPAVVVAFLCRPPPTPPPRVSRGTMLVYLDEPDEAA